MAKRKKQKLKFAVKNPSSGIKLPETEDITIPYNNKHPVFSFLCYDHDDKEGAATTITDVSDFHKMLERFKTMSELTWGDIKLSEQFHAHDVIWQQTSRPNGFTKLPAKYSGFPPFQFKIFQAFRIFGFFDKDATFHIVWFDRNHKIYPRK